MWPFFRITVIDVGKHRERAGQAKLVLHFNFNLASSGRFDCQNETAQVVSLGAFPSGSGTHLCLSVNAQSQTDGRMTFVPLCTHTHTQEAGRFLFMFSHKAASDRLQQTAAELVLH